MRSPNATVSTLNRITCPRSPTVNKQLYSGHGHTLPAPHTSQLLSSLDTSSAYTHACDGNKGGV